MWSNARARGVCLSRAASLEGEEGGWERDREHESRNVWSSPGKSLYKMRRRLRGDAHPGLLAPHFQGGAGQNCWDGMMRLHAGIPSAPFLAADPAGNAERDWLHKAALPKGGFNLIFPCLLRLDLSTGAVCGVLKHSSRCPLSRPAWAGPCAPCYRAASVGCCRWRGRGKHCHRAAQSISC